MKILKYIFLLILLAFFALTVFVATQKGDFNVTRSIIIKSPKSTVFNYVNDYRNWETLPVGQSGVIQTLSVLPRSYPGHSLLTEDLGTIYGIDNCNCGRKGTYFSIEGRIPSAELRGCSDTHAQSHPVT